MGILPYVPFRGRRNPDNLSASVKACVGLLLRFPTVSQVYGGGCKGFAIYSRCSALVFYPGPGNSP
jgi:hypothetical protein